MIERSILHGEHDNVVDVGKRAWRKIECGIGMRGSGPTSRDGRNKGILGAGVGDDEIVTFDCCGFYSAAVCASDDSTEEPRIHGGVDVVSQRRLSEVTELRERVEDLAAQFFLKRTAGIKDLGGDDVNVDDTANQPALEVGR